MPKVLCLTGMVIAISILFVCRLDLAVKFPFQRINTTMDVVFLVCAVILGYLSWSTLREQE